MTVPKRTQIYPDCEGELKPVRILDATQANGHQMTLQYAEIDAKPSAILQKVPSSGTVKGYMCKECKRIFLYG